MGRYYRSMIVTAFVVCLMIVPLVAMAKPAKNALAPVAKWTYALYVDGDNNLESYWDSYSLPWLEAVAPSSDVNIVALLDRKSTSTMEVLKISGQTVTTVETAPEMNMGDPATVTWWINKATTLWPSTYLALSMWDHGYAWIYVCKDDTSGDSLSISDLQSGILNAGKRIDILAFDACNMGNAEVAYQVSLTNLVSYLVASEETVPGNGFPYDKMLTKLVSSPAMLPKDFAIAMVDGWGEYYVGQKWANTVNLAAIDVAQLKATIGTFTTWTADMTRLLPTYRASYASALKATYYMWATHYFPDTYDYGYNLLNAKGVTDTALRTDTQNMDSAVLSYCVKVWNGAKMTDCKGIQFYFGTGNDWTSHRADYMITAFAVDTGWGNFLTAYNA